MLENDTMANSNDEINGGQIKGARTGTVSSRRSARNTAADVVFYGDDDSGLTFKNKGTKRAYERAKKRYTRKAERQRKEQEILNNPKGHFNEYIALKRDKALETALPFAMTLNPWTIGATAASAAVSIPATITSLVGSSVGGTLGSNYGEKIDANRHGYTNNATWIGLGTGAVAGGLGAGVGAGGQRFVTNKGYNYLAHNVKNIGRGFSDYFKYGVKHDKNLIYDHGLKNATSKQIELNRNLPLKQNVQVGDGIYGKFNANPQTNEVNLRWVGNKNNLGAISVNPKVSNVDFSVVTPTKQSAKWAYQSLSDVIRPGDYIGNDNTTSTLGNRLRISKTIANGDPVKFVLTMGALSKIERSPTQYGYSPDAYAQVLKIGNSPKHPYAIRYAIDPDTKFNEMGQSPLADEITYKQDWGLYTPELVREYVDLVNNKIIKPNGGDPGWIGLNGKPKFPHPYLMRK